jgi:hypothetical protein
MSFRRNRCGGAAWNEAEAHARLNTPTGADGENVGLSQQEQGGGVAVAH